MIEPFKDIEDARALAQAIVDTVREPLLVLDGDLRVLAVSRSYYLTFQVGRQDVLGRPLYALGDGQWQIPALRILLEKIIPERAAMDAFEVEHEFPRIGRRVMLLNARAVFYADHAHTTLLLAFEDVTGRRAIEREKEELLRRTEELLRQKDVLLRELEHHVANSLQIIASILILKARSVTSEETRQHLQDAHQRVMALAAVQGHLHGSERHDQIEIGPYLTRLCESLAASMIGGGRLISLQVLVNGGTAESATRPFPRGSPNLSYCAHAVLHDDRLNDKSCRRRQISKSLAIRAAAAQVSYAGPSEPSASTMALRSPNVPDDTKTTARG